MKNYSGFTIIEMLVGTMILLLVFTAILHNITLYTSLDTKNYLRNEAIKIAENCLKQLKSDIPCQNNISKNFDNLRINYTINAPNPNNFTKGLNQIQINVSYTYHNKNFSYTLNSIVYK